MRRVRYAYTFLLTTQEGRYLLEDLIGLIYFRKEKDPWWGVVNMAVCLRVT
jgi:hypothetical protein